MKNKEYIDAMKNIKPSDETIEKILAIADSEPAAETYPKPVVMKKKSSKKKFFERAVGIAACLAIVTGVYFAVGNSVPTKQNDTQPQSAAVQSSSDKPAPSEVKYFTSNKELSSYLMKHTKETDRVNLYTNGFNPIMKGDALKGDTDSLPESYGSSNDVPTTSAPTESMNASDSVTSSAQTYIQELGVDEADIIKTQGKYIYYYTHHYDEKDFSNIQKLYIFKTDNGRYTKVKEIDIKEADDTYTAQMFVSSDRLVIINQEIIPVMAAKNQETTKDVIVSDSDVTETVPYYAGSFSSRMFKSKTSATIYDISNPENPVKLETFGQSGYYVSSRLINGNLYMVTSYNCNLRNKPECDEDFLPILYKGEENSAIPCDCIAYTDNCEGNTFCVVSGINVETCERNGDTKSVLGSGDEIYCSLNNIYIYSTKYDFDTPNESTCIIKMSIKNGAPEFIGTTEISGRTDSSYSFSEKEGRLLVFTTETKNDKDVNSLSILDENLNYIKKTPYFAEDESIRAVKYTGNYAYVITYEETDPLFVFDLSDIDNPKKLGEVKITGFSTMLVDIGNNMLLGIGYDTKDVSYTYMEVTDGIKLALFDVSNPLQPKVLDSKEYPNYYSDVQQNPRCFVQNPEKGLYSFTYERSTEDAVFNGAFVFSVQDGKIIEKNNYELSEYDYDNGWYDTRITYVNDYYYLLIDNNTSDVTLESFKMP